MQIIRKLLIANRGEIAVRIAETAEKMGIFTVGIYAEDDQDSRHLKKVNKAFCVGSGELKDTYLNGSEIVRIAKISGCDAIHPGYGFLSENFEFARLCKLNNLIFIGPSSDVIRLMGNKQEANKFVKSVGIPVLDAVPVSLRNPEFKNPDMQFPVLIKAASGGGGKGMRIVNSDSELKEALIMASAEAFNYFGEGTVYIERLIEEPRHIEVQIIGDTFGNVIHLFERECSLQRRFQKIIEEAPSVSIDNKLRNKITKAAVKIAKSVGYVGAGTIEFLLDRNENFYFLEMNTRIQVEHRVTEAITGIDIVSEQISVAMGNRLRFTQDKIRISGHAVEARIYAEDPSRNFLPSTGIITYYYSPRAENLQVDSGIETGYEVKYRYDPILAKIIAFGKDRNEAISLLRKNLSKVILHGITTNTFFLKKILVDDNYLFNQIHTSYIDKNLDSILERDYNESPYDVIYFVAATLLIMLSNIKTKPSGEDSVWSAIGLWRQMIILPLKADEIIKNVEIFGNHIDRFEMNIDNQDYLINKVYYHKHRLKFNLNHIRYETVCTGDISGRLWITWNNRTLIIEREDLLCNQKAHSIKDTDSDTEKSVYSPMHGKILKINIIENSEINKNDLVLIIDSMKTENRILAPCSGRILKLHVNEGDQVETNMLLAEIE